MVVEYNFNDVALFSGMTPLKQSTPVPNPTADELPGAGFLQRLSLCNEMETLPTVSDFDNSTENASPREYELPDRLVLEADVRVKYGFALQLAPEYPEKQKHLPDLVSHVPNWPQSIVQDILATQD
jgi:hypothetical protein